jgi:hypothetical protein
MIRTPHPMPPRPRGNGAWMRRLALAWVPALVLALAAPAFAQQKKAVMENVFYNVVWGSATGALLGAALAVTGSSDKTNPADVRGSAFQGATVGGLIGYGLGVWLLFNNVTFDPQGSTLTALPDGSPDVAQAAARREAEIQLLAALPPPLFTLETSPTHPGRITGFKALVVDLRF